MAYVRRMIHHDLEGLEVEIGVSNALVRGELAKRGGI